jgi:hypothetical protein
VRTPVVLLFLSLAVVGTACTSTPAGHVGGATEGETLASSQSLRTYHGPAGWSIVLPAGWVAAPFDASGSGFSGTGSQISNMKLPPPTIVPGAPLQTNSQVLPTAGIALVVSNVNDPSVSVGTTTGPPLSMDSFAQGSYIGGGYALDAAWVSGNGKKLLATIRIGPKVSNRDMQQMNRVLASFRFD